MNTIKEALTQALATLTTSESARIDCEVLLAFVLQQSRTYLYTHPEELLTASQLQDFQKLIKQRQQGTPIAYLVGTQEFWSLSLKVSPATLIPRPETELLVEVTLNLLSAVKHARILDLGTGSGAIALALAQERPDWEILACDKSLEALQIAKENAKNLQLNNVQFLHSDWLSAIPIEKKFHAILANPPYIEACDPHLSQGDLRFEPLSALVSGKDGLKDLKKIISQSPPHLENKGLLLLEHGYLQREAVFALLKTAGYQHLKAWQDNQEHFRISGGQRIEVDE